jgi:hypothetical protein
MPERESGLQIREIGQGGERLVGLCLVVAGVRRRPSALAVALARRVGLTGDALREVFMLPPCRDRSSPDSLYQRACPTLA